MTIGTEPTNPSPRSQLAMCHELAVKGFVLREGVWEWASDKVSGTLTFLSSLVLVAVIISIATKVRFSTHGESPWH